MNKSISKFKEYSKGFRTMEPRRCKTKGCETILSQYNKMMKKNRIWVVGVRDCESNSIVATCATKEIAERELFKERDRLIKKWEAMKVFEAKSHKKFIEEKAKQGIHFGFKISEGNMYKEMIENLSGNDYKKWENYPHDCPYLYETEIITD